MQRFFITLRRVAAVGGRERGKARSATNAKRTPNGVLCVREIVGFFIALHQIIVAMRRNYKLLLWLLDLAVSAAQKRRTMAFCLCKHSPVPSHSRPASVAGSLLGLLALGTALAKNTTPWCFLLRYPLPPPPQSGCQRS